MAHGLESAASVTHQRCVDRQPVQLVTCLRSAPGQNEHRNTGATGLEGAPITVHQLQVVTGCPGCSRLVLAVPEPLQRLPAAVHAEFLPAGLLSLDLRHAVHPQTAVVHQFRRFTAGVGRQPAVQLIKADGFQPEPAALADQHREIPRPFATDLQGTQQVLQPKALTGGEAVERIKPVLHVEQFRRSCAVPAFPRCRCGVVGEVARSTG